MCALFVLGAVAWSLAGCGRMGGQTRTYFIAADEVTWNYAPAKLNRITGQPYTEEEATYVDDGPTKIGRKYKKALFREYTDDSFQELKERPQKWEHLGILGPLIRAEVGDTVKVVFRNNLKDHKASLHPHGLLYSKADEGAPYDDDTQGDDKADDAVDAGGTYTYFWDVPERAGPGPGDGSSIMWMYHSHADEVTDVQAGMMGAMIVTRAGEAGDDGAPRDVDRELVTMFMVFNENGSFFLDDNIQKFAGDPGSVDKEDPDFEESNLKHTINGFLFGNLDGLDMREGERVRWYVMGMGSEMDLHTPHWHGNDGLSEGRRIDVATLLPATTQVIDMVPDNPGRWLYHCHVDDHLKAGMQALYTVEPK